jgi:Flp pilus assembly secretin CpaC
VTATVADPTIATAVVDQAQRMLYVTGVKVGTTTVTVADSRGVTRDVPVLVAYAAGSVADQITLRVTGNPASAQYLREAIAQGVSNAATLRSGASVSVVAGDDPGARRPQHRRPHRSSTRKRSSPATATCRSAAPPT